MYVFDIESYPNFFSCVIKHRETKRRWMFEVSERMDNATEFYWFIRELQKYNCEMIGFNNIGYDYLVVHHCMGIGPEFTAIHAYEKTDDIINGNYRDRMPELWPSDYLLKQIDLYKIHHFDNRVKATGLKVLEFNMRSLNIGDLPFPPGSNLTFDQMETVLRYNAHDVDETDKFTDYTQGQIDFRRELSDQTGIDMLSYNDTKIGKKYFELELEKAVPGITGTYKRPNMTERDQIDLNECIFPSIEFETETFQNVLQHLKQTVLTETNNPPELKDLSANLNGFSYDFGAGGIHGSVKRQVVRPNDDQELIDVDVASYYPNLAIKNRVYPEHLSEIFCDIYEDLYNQRKQHPKKSAISGMLKLALNGVYGDSNNIYSRCFFDPKYTMTITINGQLLLCLLAEKVVTHMNGEIVQINTDGITALIPKAERSMFDRICKWWEDNTLLELEYTPYEAMWVRDANNYIAKGVDGKIKRIGAYAYETARENAATREIQWHKDHSALVVPKAVEAQMVHGVPVEKFITEHTDPFDFCLRGKVPRTSRLELSDGTKLQNVTRYIVANTDKALFKIMPPLLSKPGSDERRFAIQKGYYVHICDDMNDFNPSLINYDWYIQAARKLLIF